MSFSTFCMKKLNAFKYWHRIKRCVCGDCLDDVLSELDDGRKQYLLTRMREKQTFVTSCDDTAFLKTDGEVYRMNGGMLTKV